jgi:hypothetical protein
MRCIDVRVNSGERKGIRTPHLVPLLVLIALARGISADPAVPGLDLNPDAIGGRVGTNVGDDGRSVLHRYDIHAQWALPWQWRLQQGVTLKPVVEATAGLLHNDDESALIGSVTTGVDFAAGTSGFYLSATAGLLLVSDYRLGPEDFGGPLQGTFGAGVGFRIGKQLSLGYRYDHFSDAGLYGSDNRGVDMHMLELRYGLGGH